MPRASTAPLLLTLDRYARIMGLDPIHFAGGHSDLRPSGSCNSIWMQYDWQDRDKISRETLAQTIAEAEREIADEIGYWPAPVWIEDERQPYARPQRTDLYQADGLNVRGRWKSCRLKWGYVIMGGTRATEVATRWTRGADMDLDGDGFSETARWSVTVPTTWTEECEVKAYFKNYNAADVANCRIDPTSSGADPVWEVPITARTAIAAGVLTVYIKVWELFKPQLIEELDAEVLDADTAGNFVDDLLFYREYTDPETQVEFLWEPDINCTSTTGYASTYTTQDGSFAIRNARNSIVIPEPSTYDSTTGYFTPASCWSECRDPDQVRFWYAAGYRPERAHGCDLLDNWWADTIAMLATARLTLPLCNCVQARRKFDLWQTDLSEVGADRSFSIDPIVLTNPFGTRRGEVEAWKRLVKARGRIKGQAILT